MYVLVSALTFVIYGIAAGAKLTGIGGQLQMEWNGLDLLGLSGFGLWKETIFMTVLVLLALGALQYVVSMSGNALLGMFVSVAVLVSSVFWMHPLLPGNYLMLLRNEARMPGGVQVNTGIVLCEYKYRLLFCRKIYIEAKGFILIWERIDGNACFCEGRRKKDVSGDKRYQ